MSESVTSPAAIDARRFRDALGHYASGVTIVSGFEGDEPVGFTCQTFASVSLDPPLVSFSVMRTSSSYPRIARTRRFAVNVLAHDQHRISNQFARSGTDKWAGVDWRPTASGNPVIDGTLMWVDCETLAEHGAGDHLIVIGRVLEISPAESRLREPLLFFKGTYRRLRDPEELAG